jgi:hypothetical protein
LKGDFLFAILSVLLIKGILLWKFIDQLLFG